MNTKSSIKTAHRTLAKKAVRRGHVLEYEGDFITGIVTWVRTLPDGSQWARVVFPSDVFASIAAAASKLGITAQQFFDNAIRDHIWLLEIRRAA